MRCTFTITGHKKSPFSASKLVLKASVISQRNIVKPRDCSWQEYWTTKIISIRNYNETFLLGGPWLKQKRQVNGDLDVQIYSWILGLKPFLLWESLAKLGVMGGQGTARSLPKRQLLCLSEQVQKKVKWSSAGLLSLLTHGVIHYINWIWKVTFSNLPWILVWIEL